MVRPELGGGQRTRGPALLNVVNRLMFVYSLCWPPPGVEVNRSLPGDRAELWGQERAWVTDPQLLYYSDAKPRPDPSSLADDRDRAEGVMMALLRRKKTPGGSGQGRDERLPILHGGAGNFRRDPET